MLFPAMLDLGNVSVLVVGGGQVASRKVAALIACGAEVTVIAPQVEAAIEASSARIERRSWRPGDIAGHRLVVTATGDPVIDGAVHAEARAAGVWVNAADDPAHCSFLLPAVLRRGPVIVAVSTSGRSPALASWLRDRIGELIGDEAAVAAELLAARRAELHAAGRSTESVPWAEVVAAVYEEARARART